MTRGWKHGGQLLANQLAHVLVSHQHLLLLLLLLLLLELVHVLLMLQTVLVKAMMLLDLALLPHSRAGLHSEMMSLVSNLEIHLTQASPNHRPRCVLNDEAFTLKQILFNYILF